MYLNYAYTKNYHAFEYRCLYTIYIFFPECPVGKKYAQFKKPNVGVHLKILI